MSAPTPPPPATGSPSGATSPRAQKPKKELKPSQKIKAAAIITKKLVRPFVHFLISRNPPDSFDSPLPPLHARAQSRMNVAHKSLGFMLKDHPVRQRALQIVQSEWCVGGDSGGEKSKLRCASPSKSPSVLLAGSRRPPCSSSSPTACASPCTTRSTSTTRARATPPSPAQVRGAPKRLRASYSEHRESEIQHTTGRHARPHRTQRGRRGSGGAQQRGTRFVGAQPPSQHQTTSPSPPPPPNTHRAPLQPHLHGRDGAQDRRPRLRGQEHLPGR
jgi:hypothetical protein